MNLRIGHFIIYYLLDKMSDTCTGNETLCKAILITVRMNLSRSGNLGNQKTHNQTTQRHCLCSLYRFHIDRDNL